MTESVGRRSSVWSKWVALAVALAVSALVLGRVAVDGVQPYGTDGAHYIEHVARLAALDHWRASEQSNLWASLLAADGSFPATLHYLTLPLGALFGHGTGVAAASGLLWLLLLAAAVGWLGRRLSGRGEVGWAAFTACLLVPAFHGMATRYYYDLPMIALLWCGVALLVEAQRPRRTGIALAAGLCFLLACLVKWAAIPYGLFLGLAALLLAPSGDRSGLLHRLVAGLAAVGVPALGVTLYFQGVEGVSSFGHQAHITLPAAQAVGATGPVEGSGLGLLLSQVPGQLAGHSLASLAFYPLRLVFSVLSLPLAAVLAMLCWSWWRSGRPGLIGLAGALGAWTMFHLGVVPILDDRFLTVVVPVFVLVGSLGWGSLPRSTSTRLGVVVLALGLVIAVDFHVSQGNPLAWAVELIEEDDVPPGRSTQTVARGLGASGSKEQRGWARHDEVAVVSVHADRRGLRGEAWRRVRGCKIDWIGGAVEWGAIDLRGDKDWWEYRSRLSELTETPSWQTSFSSGPSLGSAPCAELPFGGWAHQKPGYVLLPGDEPWRGLADCAGPAGWVLDQLIEDPAGGPGVQLWRQDDLPACPDSSP